MKSKYEKLIEQLLLKKDIFCKCEKRRACDSFYIEENNKLVHEMKKLIDYNKKLQEELDKLKGKTNEK